MNIYKYKYKFKKKIKKIKTETNKKYYKLIIIILLIISISTLYYYSKSIFSSNKISKNIIIKQNTKNETNTTWFQGNVGEILDKYFNIIPQQYGEMRMNYQNKFNKIFSLKNFDDNDKHTKKLFLDKMTEKFKKNASFVNTLFITHSCFYGNQICSLNNIIFYSEILGIKNIYLNSKFDNWYIKNNITTGKLKISVVPNSQINCQSKDIFCGHIFYDFFFL